MTNRLAAEVHTEVDRSGMGMVYRVIVDGVLVWAHAFAMDGALDPEAEALFDALPKGGKG